MKDYVISIRVVLQTDEQTIYQAKGGPSDPFYELSAIHDWRLFGRLPEIV